MKSKECSLGRLINTTNQRIIRRFTLKTKVKTESVVFCDCLFENKRNATMRRNAVIVYICVWNLFVNERTVFLRCLKHSKVFGTVLLKAKQCSNIL